MACGVRPSPQGRRFGIDQQRLGEGHARQFQSEFGNCIGHRSANLMTVRLGKTRKGGVHSISMQRSPEYPAE